MRLKRLRRKDCGRADESIQGSDILRTLILVDSEGVKLWLLPSESCLKNNDDEDHMEGLNKLNSWKIVVLRSVLTRSGH